MSWDFVDKLLSEGASVAEIVTAIVAAGAAIRFYLRGKRRREMLESYLKKQRAFDEEYTFGASGQRTVLHLMAKLAMTDAQVLDAAFSSKVIRRYMSSDPDTGRADALFFQYHPKGGTENLDETLDRIMQSIKKE